MLNKYSIGRKKIHNQPLDEEDYVLIIIHTVRVVFLLPESLL